MDRRRIGLAAWSAFAAVLVGTAGSARGGPATAPAAKTDPGPCRAARATAARELADRVRGLSAGEAGTVGEVLGQAAGLSLEAAVLAAAESSAPSADGAACTVTVTLSRPALAEALQRLCRRGRISADLSDVALPDGAEALTASARATGSPAPPGPPAVPRAGGLEYFPRAPAAVRDFWQAHVTEAGRRHAEQAAREDAMARLARRIEQVHVTVEQDLAAFVKARSETPADLRGFLRAARERSLAYHADAPVVEAEVTVALRTVYACVKTWVHRLPKPAAADIRRLEELIVAARGESIRQLGVGAAPEKELTKATPAMRRAAAAAAAAPAWVGRSLRQAGSAAVEGEAPQRPAARRGALAAAEAEARAGLARRVAELNAAPDATVAELAGDRPDRRAALLAVLQCARAAAQPRVTDDGRAEVELELGLDELWRLVLDWRMAGE